MICISKPSIKATQMVWICTMLIYSNTAHNNTVNYSV